MKSKYKYLWDMTEKDWEDLISDHKSRHTGAKISEHAGTYGHVRIGNLCAEILHTLDKGDWYAFSNVYAIGVDSGYGITEDGIPYTLMEGTPVVPIRRQSFKSFKEAFELHFEAWIKKSVDRICLADNPVHPFPYKKEVFSKKFGLVLKAKPSEFGLTRSEVCDLFDLLASEEVYPIELGALTHDCIAMGFIAPTCAAMLDCDYENSGVHAFIASILDDMENESGDYVYEYSYNGHNILIYLSR